MSKLLVTAGEPAGIGPDIVLKLAQRAQQHPWAVIADPHLLKRRAEQLALPIVLREYNPRTFKSTPAGELTFIAQPLNAPVLAGQLSVKNADYVLQTLRQAHQRVHAGEFDAIVTGPVHKGIINQAGIPFTGHTEFFRDQARVDDVIMMLATKELRVSLITTHCPLHAVAPQIKKERLLNHFVRMNNFLRDQAQIKQPRIFVAGLNPHAGEMGHIGHEEIEEITPAIEAGRAQGIDLIGPMSADTLFTPKYLAQSDLMVCMYHDQGLPVLKHVGFSRAVNITVGLPYIRTSVDHGVALELAATGQADEASLQYALDYASSLKSQGSITKIDEVACG